MDTPQLPPLPRRQPLNDVTQYINPDIHGGRMSWAGVRGGIRNERPDTYKTVICQSWLESGGCAFGENCRFAHGEHELRPMSIRNIRNASKYKTKLCDKYTKTGICPYGSRCLFIHPAPRSGTTYYNTPIAPPQPLMKIPLHHLTSTPLNNVNNCTCCHSQPQTGMDGTPVRHDPSFHHRHASGFPSWLSDPSALNGFASVENFSPPNPSPLMMPLSVDVGKQRSMSDSVVGGNWAGSLTETLPEAFDAPMKENTGTSNADFNPFTSVSPFSALNPFATKPSPSGTSVSNATSPYSSIFSLSSGIWSPDNEPAKLDLESLVYPSDQYGVPFSSSGAFGSIGSRSLGQNEHTPTLGQLTAAPPQTINPWADETTTIQQSSNERVASSAGPVEMLESLNL